MKVKIEAGQIGNVFTADIINYNSDTDKWQHYVQERKPVSKKEIRIFLSYAHADNEIKEQLDNHLVYLKRRYETFIWTDRMIMPGSEWDATIKTELENADIILLLISAGFIASEYIWNVELARAIEKHNAGNATVIPIFCKACNFEAMPFAKIQGLPANAAPINTAPDIDAALKNVVQGIGLVIEALSKAQ